MVGAHPLDPVADISQFRVVEGADAGSELAGVGRLQGVADDSGTCASIISGLPLDGVRGALAFDHVKVRLTGSGVVLASASC